MHGAAVYNIFKSKTSKETTNQESSKNEQNLKWGSGIERSAAELTATLHKNYIYIYVDIVH